MDRNVEELIDIVCDIMYDMGDHSTGMCLYYKAKLRIAFEPFLHTFGDQEYLKSHIMDLNTAMDIVNKADNNV
jgi:hypothetical protein